MPTDKPICLIHNPGAGSSDQSKIDDFKAHLQSTGYQVAIEEGENPTKTAKKAITNGHTHLCACGGDGTVCGTVTALLNQNVQDATLSILPLGTGNFIALALNIAEDPKEAAEIIAQNHTQQIDVGKIQEHAVLIGIGIGATEHLVTNTPDHEKENLGRIAYLKTLLTRRRDPRFQVELQIDGQTTTIHQAQAVTVASIWGTQTANLLPDTAYNDGQFEVMVNKSFHLWTLIKLAFLSLLGKPETEPDITIKSGKSFQIKTTPPQKIQLDGNESDLKTPVTLKVLPKHLKVTVPSD